MACFLVPAAEAVVTTVIAKAVKTHEAKSETVSDNSDKITLSHKLGRLSGFLWGGSGLLAFEHLWHGEISPVFPFLTAAGDPEAMSVVIHEMATAGVCMALLVTVFWASLTVGEDILRRRSVTEKTGEDSV
ncbi:MAG: hypothetical protein MR038_00415 [Oscillospiraceae bacterium]|nr:hypothetical protein [Oscillospiraceae bacterium]